MLYRNHYLIGVYAPKNEGETLLALCENSQEFAELLEISIESSRMILSNIFRGKYNLIRFFGRKCTVEFIREDE